MVKLIKTPTPFMEFPPPKQKPRYRWNYQKKRWFYIKDSMMEEKK